MFLVNLITSIFSPVIYLVPLSLYIIFKIKNKNRKLPDQRLASFEIRSLAYAIDFLLIIGITILLTYITGSNSKTLLESNASNIVFLFIIINILVLPSFTGWSIGKRIVGIKILKKNNKAGFIDILYREIIKGALSVGLLFIGCLWMIIGKKQLTWQDSVADTNVFKIKSLKAEAIAD